MPRKLLKKNYIEKSVKLHDKIEEEMNKPRPSQQVLDELESQFKKLKEFEIVEPSKRSYTLTKAKKELEKTLNPIAMKYSGIKTFSTESATNNAFWKRPKRFFDELRKIKNLEFTVTKLEDYPNGKDLKSWRVEGYDKNNPAIRCYYKVITYGQGEIGENKNEILIYGECFKGFSYLSEIRNTTEDILLDVETDKISKNRAINQLKEMIPLIKRSKQLELAKKYNKEEAVYMVNQALNQLEQDGIAKSIRKNVKKYNKRKTETKRKK